MASPCPTSGYTCVNTLVARIRTVSDQVTGIVAGLRGGLVDSAGLPLLYHYERLGALLMEAVEAYTEDHGDPTVVEDIQSVHWLMERLLK